MSPAAQVQAIYALDNAPPASGADGLALEGMYRDAFRQWQDRPSNILAFSIDDDGIGHVPLKKIGTMKVRFKAAQPMKPRAITIEVDETE